jgi:hypothetical protein
MRAPALQWERLRMAQREWRRHVAEEILLQYHDGLMDYARAKEELIDAWYTREQASRMLVRVARLRLQCTGQFPTAPQVSS